MTEPKPCPPCREYRVGERENVRAYGFVVHACERKQEGGWGFLSCPCGCAVREPGRIAQDRVTYGNAYLGPRGERLDPATITAVFDDGREPSWLRVP